MTCQELDQRLDDWLAGALAPSEAASVEAHLAGCAACREAERKLRRVLAHAAALPRSLAPRRDLWPEIEQRLARPRERSWAFAWRSPLALAAAATVVLGLVAVLWRHQPAATVKTAEIPVASSTFQAVSESLVADPVLAQAEREYEAAANALLQTLRERARQVRLAPEELSRISRNLELIDQALAELRQAIARDPANPELNRMLVATHKKKVDVLRRIVMLSTDL